jgi:carboxypeptidase C (cathepsin A)
MEWSGQEGYRSQKAREWLVGGKRAGKTRSYGGLTFATVDGAGHMVSVVVPLMIVLAITHLA